MKTLVKCLFVIPLFFMACQENEIVSTPVEEANALKLDESAFIKIDKSIYGKSTVGKQSLEDYVASINEALVDEGIQLSKMEVLGHKEAGITVHFKTVGNQHLPADWVPDDPRNFFPGTNQLYWVDGTELATTSGMTDTEVLNGINSAMSTWGTISCSEGLDIVDAYVTTPNDIYNDVGVMQRLRGFGGAFWVIRGAILFGGTLQPEFFDTLMPNGSNNIAGVTFTWIFTNQGEPTDIDNNGKRDVAFREIYFNDKFNWQDAPDDVINNGIIDFETVALHEAGHGLSQGHFGKAFTDNKGEVHFAPRAVMNSGAKGAQRELLGTDNGGHCGIWDGWPYE